jgi:hypothetical protein
MGRLFRYGFLATSTALLACSSSDSADPGGTPDGTLDDTTTSESSTDTLGSDVTTEGGGDTAPPCGTDPWLTYGHDGRRTSATDGCIGGALTTLWRYVPTPAAGKVAKRVFNAIAQTDAIYFTWAQNNAAYLGTTSLDRVSKDGARVWNFDSGTDSNFGHWPILALGSVILNDDGVYYLDPAKGTKTTSTGVDFWGEMATDGTRLYLVNDAHVDGPEVFVGAYDGTGKKIWTQNVYGKCRIDANELNDGLALDSGVVFYAARYVTGTGVTLPFESGVFAFDAAAGTPKWSKTTKPMSMISAGNGRVYLVEDTKLVARGQADGAIAWELPLAGAGTQAPVLAGGLVIVGTSAGVVAVDEKAGTIKWTAPMSGAAAPAPSITFSGGCAGNVAETYGGVTTIAAALGSGTLVVTASDGIHVVKLTGEEVVKAAVDKAVGPVKNPVIIGDRVYVVDSAGLVALAVK